MIRPFQGSDFYQEQVFNGMIFMGWDMLLCVVPIFNSIA
jgi:hypothetical protein